LIVGGPNYGDKLAPGLIPINVLFIFGMAAWAASISKAVVNSSARKRSSQRWTQILVFFVIQIIVVPLVWGSILYAMCGPLHL